MRTLFILSLILGLSVQLFGQMNSITSLENGRNQFDLKDAFSVAPDNSRRYSIESLRSIPFQNRKENFSNDVSRVWMNAKLKNQSNEKLEWWLYTGVNDYVKVWLIDESGIKKEYKTGYLVKGSEKPAVVGSYIVPLTLEKGKIYEIIVLIEKDFHALDFNFELQHESYRIDNFWPKRLWAYFLQGILWIMVIYALSVYFRSRDRTYLFYGLYLGSVAVFYWFVDAVLRELMIPEFPQYAYLGILAIYPAAIFYFLFLKDFLSLSKERTKIHGIVRAIVIFDVIMIISFIALFFLFDDKVIIQYFSQVVIVVNAVTGLVCLVLLFNLKHPLARFFITGSLFFMLAVIVDGITWDSNLVLSSVTKIGLVIEVIFFSLGLGERMRMLERSKREAKEDLIKHLEKVKRINERQRVELEEKVSIRTQELESKNADLLHAKETAESAAKAKTDFLSVMSHEIRTPVNGVIGMTHFLLNENPRPEQIENLKSLKFSAENLLLLLNDILDYSKFESEGIELEKIDFSIKELTRGIGYQFKPRALSQGIKFRIFLDQDIPEFLIGDPGRLSQVLLNLISNAIKFTKQGEVLLKIELVEQKGASCELKFSVEDTGIGIPREKLDVIFNQFTQASSDTTRKFGGTGLGLSITKKLTEKMGSPVQVESEVGKGSSFTFSLNLGIGVGEKNSEEDTQIEKKIEEVKGMKILAVDDNKMNRIVLEKFLKKWEIEVNSVEDGPTAIEAITSNDFDLILLDIQMPEMDGFQVTQIIRGMVGDKYRKIPIVALSADIFANVYDQVLDVGMDDFVSKPFNPDELLSVIHRYVQREDSTPPKL